ATIITVVFVAITVVLTFIISMTLALILNTEVVGARFLRSIMMIPWVIPTVIAGLLWAWIYANPYGLLQYLVNIFSDGAITDFGMLNNSNTALWGVIIAALWKQIPLIALLLLSGMQSIPDDIIEAAKIDGANYWKCLFNVILPHIKSVIAVTMSMCIIENFKQYPLFATLTNGGPNGATTTFAVLSYDEAFINFNYGSGAAVTTVWLLLMVIVVFVFNRFFKMEKG
ncbi:MAG: carbohydrate ABC transporter permease, partial [Lachnospirales bacterium]